MKRTALVLIPILLGCSEILSPGETRLQVLNETASNLEVLAAPCESRDLLEFALLEPGASHIEVVSTGCWVVVGWQGDLRAGASEVFVKEGALNQVPFYDEEER